MHEYPITQQIIKICEKHCRDAGGERVAKIKLVIGDRSGLMGDSIQMYFDIIAEGTMCENAKIEMVHIKPKLKCPNCQELFYRQPLSFSCPKCGTDGEPTEIGKEFYIDNIEIE